jgi:hypothetical protein
VFVKVAIIPDRIVKKYSKEEDKLHFVLVPRKEDIFNPNPLQGLIIFPYWMLYAYDDKRAASR